MLSWTWSHTGTLAVAFACIGWIPLAFTKEYLYAWVGSGTGGADYVAVIDFDKKSKNYGDVVGKTKLTNSATRSKSGNEPHHSLITTDHKGKKVLITGGLLSFLNGKDDLFVWDIDTDPENPTLIASYDLPGGCTDEINPFRQGVLVSMMCNDSAGSPGTFAYLNLRTGKVREWLNSSALTNFNPHGFDINKQTGFLMATDYIVPSSLVSGPPEFHNTVPRLDLDRNNPALDHIYKVPGNPGGMMDFRFIPGTTKGYVSGTNNNKLYIVNAAQNSDPTFVLDLAQAVNNNGVQMLSVGMFRYTQDTQAFYMTLGQQYMCALNIRNKKKPKVYFCHDCCTDYVTGEESFDCSMGNVPGTHYLLLTPDEKRVVVVNYFLQFGILTNDAAKTIAVFDITRQKDGLPLPDYDKDFDLDFSPDQPHSVQYLKAA